MGTRQEISELPPEADLARADSLAREIFSDIANKWALLIIEFLGQRTMRFNELRREIDGISQRMLSVTLRHLERDGLVCRTVYAEVPPRVEYCLSPLGHTLLATIQALVSWTEAHQQEIAEARAAFDAAGPAAVAASR